MTLPDRPLASALEAPIDSPGSAPGYGGWGMVLHLTGAVALLLAALVAIGGLNPESLRAAVRWIGACSLALFLSAYTAAPLAEAVPCALTRWQRANRRYLGVSFALCHLLHALALVALRASSASSFSDQLGAPLVALLLLGYGFVLAMLATSFDRTAAWLGPRRWRALHLCGLHYVWMLFFVAYLRGVRGSLLLLVPLALLASAGALRARRAWLRRRAPRSAPGSGTARG
jgi:hypothetical protein